MFDLAIDGDTTMLRLARPAARNAIELAGWSELADRAEAAVDAGARAIIVAGEPGGTFSAGADLASFDAFANDSQARTDFRTAIRNGLDRLRDVPVPTIALVEGACFGAGVALAMACDLRIAGPQAQFGITPAKLGISYPQEDVHKLVALVGPGQASRLLFTASAVDAREALRIGLIELYAEDEAAEAAAALASSIAANDPASLCTLKRSIRLALSGRPSDEEQDRAFDGLLGSDALTERLAKLRARRA